MHYEWYDENFVINISAGYKYCTLSKIIIIIIILIIIIIKIVDSWIFDFKQENR